MKASDLVPNKASLEPLPGRDRQTTEGRRDPAGSSLLEQRQALGNQALQRVLRAEGTGHSLDTSTAHNFKNVFGRDFSKVRIHDDTQAAEAARALNAKAFTIGNDIFFRREAYDTRSPHGRETLAHELVHILQQERTINSPQRILSRPTDPAEREAATIAAQYRAGKGLISDVQTPPAAGIHRQMTSPEAPASVPASEPTSSETPTETRYTLTLSSGTLTEVMEVEAVQALANVYAGTKLNVDLLEGEHHLLRQARDSDPFIGVGGFLVDLVGDTMPALEIWDPARNHLMTARAALASKDVIAAANSLSEADAAYQDALRQWQSYKEQLADAGTRAIVGLVVVAVVLAATAVIVAGVAAAAGAGEAAAAATGEAVVQGATEAVAEMAAEVVVGETTAIGGSTLPGLGAPAAAAEAAVALTQPVNPIGGTLPPALAPTMPAAAAAAGAVTTASAEAGAGVITGVGAAIAEGGLDAGIAAATRIAANPEGLRLVSAVFFAAQAALNNPNPAWTVEQRQLLSAIVFALYRANAVSPAHP